MTIEERIKNDLCCFCEAPLDGMGNNPDPACTWENAGCCDICNLAIVYPARIYIDKTIREGLNPELRKAVKDCLQSVKEEALKKYEASMNQHLK